VNFWATTTRSAIRGYFGAGFLTQHRKPFGGDLLNASGKKFNRANEIRYVIERVISQCQAWRTTPRLAQAKTVPTPRQWALSSDH
jgi:hypothetical protein